MLNVTDNEHPKDDFDELQPEFLKFLPPSLTKLYFDYHPALLITKDGNTSYLVSNIEEASIDPDGKVWLQFKLLYWEYEDIQLLENSIGGSRISIISGSYFTDIINILFDSITTVLTIKNLTESCNSGEEEFVEEDFPEGYPPSATVIHLFPD